MEIWKDIEGYEGCYQISNYGNVRALDRIVKVFHKKPHPHIRLRKLKGMILIPALQGYGYPQVSLCNGTSKSYLIHKLVLNSFVGKNSGMDCNHINGIKTDNRLENLEWCTRSENVQHAYDTGLSNKGETHSRAKLNELQARIIRRLKGDMFLKEVANIFRIDPTQVSNIQLKKSWKHI